MPLIDLVILLVIAGLCGSFGSGLAGHGSPGWLGSIALGFIGALLGAWLARKLHLPEILTFPIGSKGFPVLWSIVGSALFSGVLSIFTRRRGYY